MVAIGGAAREALRLADVLEAMLLGLRDAFARGRPRKTVGETRRMDDMLDKLNTAPSRATSRRLTRRHSVRPITAASARSWRSPRTWSTPAISSTTTCWAWPQRKSNEA